jgi:hypothetical protein
VTYELRVIPDCPNSASALELFQRALAAESTAADIRVVELSSDEQAHSLNFHGSPSFIADGRDLFPSSTAPGMTCRVYQTEAGLAGLPAQKDLQTALRSA